ncbi:ABC transporter permease [Kaistia dalseonensis]|uniref:Spermidine/putrescine transport system permease protein n=1 Tax=Kaistia dalseonensis TaxID=410840 RepID=A0ABU0H0T2_9HYPH|nr:ABC transporter permease [Kaistia dalseonensis]MCX5493364.1 ABC transporter permease [Kaistia dalseonensis]MDQ0435922.1 spermidine/putrescine transport system permease protein [Kaistia dalseonensis]
MHRASPLLLTLPALLVIGIFMLVPLGYGVAYSFLTASPYGGAQLPFTFEGYQQVLFQRDFDESLYFTTTYLAIIFRSVVLASAAAILCAVLGLPVAWFIACQPAKWRTWLVFVVTLPFWVNSLIRTYCWVLLLRDQGLINLALQKSGLTSGPIGLMYNDGATLLGLVYNFLPFMVLPIYAALERLDPRLIEAAHDLYATRAKVFSRIIIPLALPGLKAGALLVFAPALGYFLVPDLLGGGRNLMIGNLIQIEFTSGRNWPFGAALSVLVTGAVMLVLMIGAMRGKRRKLSDIVGDQL